MPLFQEDDNLSEVTYSPSKSQRKREAHALQDLGAKLVALKPVQLQHLPLPDELREAVQAAQGMRQHGAHRRQLQYIGKLMRHIDAEPIRTALAELAAGQRAAARHQQYVETYCDALLAGDNEALNDFCLRYPTADQQALRQLIRNATGESARQRKAHARRALLRWLRKIMTTSTTLAIDSD